MTRPKYIDYQRAKWEGVRRSDAPDPEPGFEAVGRTLEGGAALSYGVPHLYQFSAVRPVLQRYGAPSPMAGFWADLFATHPDVVVSQEQRDLMAQWPEGDDTYRIAELIPFLDQLIAEAQRVQAKIGPVASRMSFLAWGPSDEFISKVQGINVELSKIAIRMAKRAKYAKFDAAKKGFTAITFPDLRKDAFAMMSLTRSLDWFAELEGGPSWIGGATFAIVEAFVRTGAWMVEVGAKIAKPFVALLSNIDLLIWGGLGLLGLWGYKKWRHK